MGRPLSKHAKHRREYVIRCVDPHFHAQKFFVRNGYKSLLLKEYVDRYPDHNISIYVLSSSSSSVFHNIK